MNHDVNDGKGPLDAPKGRDEQSSNNSNTIFSQLRSFSNNLAVNSLGSLFNSTPSSSSHKSLDPESWNDCNLFKAPSPLNAKDGSLDEGLTPTPSRPSSPHRRFTGVKNIFTNLTSRSSRQQLQAVRITVAQTQVHTNEPSDAMAAENSTPRYEPLTSPLDSAFSSLSGYSPSGSFGSSELDETPPLTPESLVADLALLSPASQNVELGFGYQYDYNEPHVEGGDHYMRMDDELDVQYGYVRPHSMEIKEGKKPARPINFDALLADISNDTDTPEVLLENELLAHASGNTDIDDQDEWYGLEYTLELSNRERRASETHSLSGGEHSKSRESWAAIHQGTVHPFFEREEYFEWQKWHRYLDRQDEKRKHRRGRAFKAHAKELAWCYADEMHMRDLMSWQMEVYGYVEKEVFERFRMLEAHRPDPYCPPQKHDIGWYLKRSRSVACIRELRTLPEPTTLQLQKRAISNKT
ncbi:hypothetical protein C8R43DRAFT_1168403 [Mycena crocata]|nr:hypothetical protein C8R43DRAFT_1168403 [Mycena crocata]